MNEDLKSGAVLLASALAGMGKVQVGDIVISNVTINGGSGGALAFSMVTALLIIRTWRKSRS